MCLTCAVRLTASDFSDDVLNPPTNMYWEFWFPVMWDCVLCLNIFEQAEMFIACSSVCQ